MADDGQQRPKASPPRQSHAMAAPVGGTNDDRCAKAMHLVEHKRMTLHRAAERYGVQRDVLYRRLRHQYSSSRAPSQEIRKFLSYDDEEQVLRVLLDQFRHENRVTSDDVRYITRAIAKKDGSTFLPPEFPPSDWITEFKRAHGLATPYDSVNLSLGVHGQRGGATCYQHKNDRQPHQFNERTDDNSRSRSGDASQFSTAHDTYSSTTSASAYDSGRTSSSSSSGEMERRTCTQRNAVSLEVWAKAVTAVKRNRMSLRTAADLYGVHCDALHRRVKKRTTRDKSEPTRYRTLQSDDEVGIIRVAIARAELGLQLNLHEVMDLVQRVALKNRPNLSVKAVRQLMHRFQTRNRHVIRHIISDWP